MPAMSRMSLICGASHLSLLYLHSSHPGDHYSMLHNQHVPRHSSEVDIWTVQFVVTLSLSYNLIIYYMTWFHHSMDLWADSIKAMNEGLPAMTNLSECKLA